MKYLLLSLFTSILFIQNCVGQQSWTEVPKTGIEDNAINGIFTDNDNNVYATAYTTGSYNSADIYKLNTATNTWEKISVEGIEYHYSYTVYSGINNSFYLVAYYVTSTGGVGYKIYKTNKISNNTSWTEVPKTGIEDNSINGIFTDNNNNVYATAYTTGSYNSADIYKLNTVTNTWEKISVEGIEYHYSYTVYSDINNSFYLVAYYVTSTGSVGCKVYKTNFGELGTERIEVAKNNIIMYPNPTKEVLFIKSIKYQINSVKIYDSKGVMVNSILNLTSNIIKIDLSRLNSGIYYVKVNTSDGGIICKTIIID